MRTLVRIVAGFVSSGSCCVKPVNSGAFCHAGSFKSPSMTGETRTRTACKTGCSGQLAAPATRARSKMSRNLRIDMDSKCGKVWMDVTICDSSPQSRVPGPESRGCEADSGLGTLFHVHTRHVPLLRRNIRAHLRG